MPSKTRSSPQHLYNILSTLLVVVFGKIIFKGVRKGGESDDRKECVTADIVEAQAAIPGHVLPNVGHLTPVPGVNGR